LVTVLASFSLLTLRQETVWNDSESMWRRVVAVNPQLVDGYFNLGVVLFMSGRTAETISCYRTAMDIIAAHAVYGGGYALEAESRQFFITAISDSRYNNGSRLIGEGRLDEAAGYFLEVLKVLPENVSSRVVLGYIRTLQGRTPEAITYYREALSLDRNNSEAHAGVGFLLAAQGKTTEAVIHGREAVRLAPGSVANRCNLALELVKLGDLKGAEEQYHRAVIIEPGRVETRDSLGFVLSLLGKYKEAEASCREALRLEPAFHGAYCNQVRHMGGAVSSPSFISEKR
jgi:tetratricopeptide (TPR) repeat protein